VVLNAEQAFAALTKMTWSPEVARLVETARVRLVAWQERAFDVETSARRCEKH
jgi:hypothetical protein